MWHEKQATGAPGILRGIVTTTLARLRRKPKPRNADKRPTRRNTKIDFPIIYEVDVSPLAFFLVAIASRLTGIAAALWVRSRGRTKRRVPRRADLGSGSIHARPPFVVEYVLTLVGAYLVGILSILSCERAQDIRALLRLGVSLTASLVRSWFR